ncbi:thiol-activated cytolysin family protein [Sphingobacterium spiritivorum]|uniref:thiol-activated cytolysin family protein n=1 Tax=Sphingobacterium spiritivorum TaxID=258 RepID=UPI00191988A3|nr:thiol-activated cytolysin family protein [Sphingobacterium spiritivorum]QQT24804.1 thiol-activated cytolysin family protein [Sphingobacterium spiritivorum]
MIKLHSYLILSLTVLSVVSCKKNGIDEPKPPIIEQQARSKKEIVDSLKTDLVKKGYSISSQVINQDSTKVNFRVSRANSIKEFGVFEPGGGSDQKTYPDLYTGSVFNGNVFVKDGVYSTGLPLEGKTLPLNQDIVIVGKNKVKIAEAKQLELRNSSLKQFQSDILRQIGEPAINQHVGDVSLKTGFFSSFTDVKDSVFFNRSNMYLDSFKPGVGLLEYAPDNTPVPGKGVFAFFRQDYYSIQIDKTKAGWKFLEEELSNALQVERMPIFINSITYGRYGFVTIEGNQSQEIMAMLNKAIANFDSLSEFERTILSKSTIRCYFFGTPEDWRFSQLLQSSLGRLQLFTEIMNQKTYKFRPFGDAPTFYSFSSVKDNSAFIGSTLERDMEFDLKDIL